MVHKLTEIFYDNIWLYCFVLLFFFCYIHSNSCTLILLSLTSWATAADVVLFYLLFSTTTDLEQVRDSGWKHKLRMLSSKLFSWHLNLKFHLMKLIFILIFILFGSILPLLIYISFHYFCTLTPVTYPCYHNLGRE